MTLFYRFKMSYTLTFQPIDLQNVYKNTIIKNIIALVTRRENLTHIEALLQILCVL